MADAGGSCHDGGECLAPPAGHAPGRGLRCDWLGVHRRHGHRASDPPATIVIPGDPPGDRRRPGHVGRPDRGGYGMRPLRAARAENVSGAQGMGSQRGSQRRQTSGHIRRQPAMVSAARSPIRSLPATSSDAAYAPENRTARQKRPAASLSGTQGLPTCRDDNGAGCRASDPVCLNLACRREQPIDAPGLPVHEGLSGCGRRL